MNKYKLPCLSITLVMVIFCTSYILLFSSNLTQAQTNPKTTVLSPNGGEVWPRNSVQTITWKTTGAVANVSVQLVKGAYIYRSIIKSTPNTGSYQWIIPTDIPEGTDYKIRVKGTGAAYLALDKSDNFFSIMGTVSGPAPTVIPTSTPTASGNNAQFIAQSIPSTMNAGQDYTAYLTFKNTGTTTWTKHNTSSNSFGYNLGSQNPQDNSTWSINRVALPSNSILPGTQETFVFNVKAPSTAGTHNFQWRMVQEMKEWFGDFSPNVAVNVVSATPTPTPSPTPTPPPSSCLSDGINWTQATANAAWSGRNLGSALVYDNKMWIMGGYAGMDTNDVWYSTDGVNWTQATANAAWSDREAFHTLVYDNKMWVLGGQTSGGNDNDVWYSGCSSVPTPTPTPTPTPVATNNAQYISQSVPTIMTAGATYPVSVTMKNTGTSTWTKGTLFRLGSQNPQDNLIWGLGRVELTASESFAPGTQKTFNFNVIAPVTAGSHNFQWQMVQDGVAWFGDKSTNVAVNVTVATPTPTACTSDGQTWIQATANAPWAGRQNFSSAVFDNKMWVFGGSGGGLNKSDVWYSSNGINWTQATGNAGWGKRFGHRSLAFNNKLWVFGGIIEVSPNSVEVNDVWSSADGVNWTRVTANAGWTPRQLFEAVVFDNKIWIMGGQSSALGTRLNDVWYSSDGINWTQATSSAEWPQRMLFSSAVADGRMWIMGGYFGSNPLNDVWYSSNGINWTQATGNAGWSKRAYLSSAVCNNKIFIIGGYNIGPIGDVWSSFNGMDWNQSTGNPAWGSRMSHESLFFDNKLWLMGGWSGSIKNDVWYSQ